MDCPAALEGDGNTSVAITINENKSILYRKAIITLRTTGNIPAEKTITIIQTDAEPVIDFNPLDGEDAEYDSGTKSLTVGYVGNSHRIGFWSNIDNYRMIIKPMNQGDDISWVKGFKVSEEDGIVSFTTSHNFTGAERTVIIRMDAEGFEGADYYLTQKVSLYKNILKTVEGAHYNDAQPQPRYSIKNKAITLLYESDETLEVEVIDKATSQPATWARATMAGTTASLSIDINSEVNEREAIVRVKSTNT